MPLQPIGKSNLVQSVVDSIIESVKNGTFNAGDRLPSIKEISETLKVSISSVREGLKQLQSMGIILIQHGVGMYVSESVDFKKVLDSYKNLITLQKQNFDEVMEARIITECETARLSAKRSDKNDVEELENLISAMKKSVYDLKKYKQYDVKFHTAIAKASKNSVLVTFLESIQGLISSIVEEMSLLPKQIESSKIAHEKIFRAIKNHDSTGACEMMKKHLTQVEKTARLFLYKDE